MLLSFRSRRATIMLPQERRLPLDKLKVLELGQLIAGPFATKMFGEFGADVIKIEPPGTGDPLRRWRMIEDGTSLWWHVQTRNKRSVSLDLRSQEGQDRSEERRVGKECRSRWWTYQEKRKI